MIFIGIKNQTATNRKTNKCASKNFESSLLKYLGGDAPTKKKAEVARSKWWFFVKLYTATHRQAVFQRATRARNCYSQAAKNCINGSLTTKDSLKNIAGDALGSATLQNKRALHLLPRHQLWVQLGINEHFCKIQLRMPWLIPNFAFPKSARATPCDARKGVCTRWFWTSQNQELIKGSLSQIENWSPPP